MPSDKLPTRVFAGVAIPNTPLIAKALAFARGHSADFAYNHVYRAFVFGFIFASKNPQFKDLDIEAHAVAAILHDIGWDPTGELVSKDKRFEVDGANAARDFLKREAPDWDKHRVQLVWDAIALHSTMSIAPYKEPEVAVTAFGTMADVVGPDGSPWLTWDEYDAVVKELPMLQCHKNVKEVACGICRTKPESTFDNFFGIWGEKYVEGYREKRMLGLDALEAAVIKLDERNA